MKLVIFQFTSVMAAVLFLAQPSLAAAANASRPTALGKNLFQANCLVCHGEDGTGSVVGKSMNTPNLQSKKVQKQSDPMLAHFISAGNGRMPAFKDRLDHKQIVDVVRFIRSLPANKSAHP